MKLSPMLKCRPFPVPCLRQSLPRTASRLVAFAVLLFMLAPALAQTNFKLPLWLVSYPGTHPAVYSSDSFAQSSYVVDAQPSEVVAHYRKLFEAQGLVFQPNPDGRGITIRASAKECDLFIQIRRREEGTYTKVTCSGKVDTSSIQSAAAPDIEMITGITPPPPPASAAAKAVGEHQRAPLSPIKINKVPHNMPAPPLLWPGWLTRFHGDALKPTMKTDPTGFKSLNAKYTTDAPMTEIFDFYRNLLLDHDYRPRSDLAAGHTSSGVQQDAMGTVDGVHYVDGAPGANTTIEISMDRTVLNGPITVSVRFSSHDFSIRERRGNR